MRAAPAYFGEIAMLTGALIFLGMWVTVGRIEEVRIFLPFALALVPLTIEIALQQFLPTIETQSGTRLPVL